MFKKSLIALSAVAAIATTSVANDDVMAQLEALKAQIAKLEAQLNQQDKKIVTVEKSVKKNAQKVDLVKAHDAGDNIKWDVDFRTQMDSITYKLGNGTKLKNSSVLSNRLWLGMKYQADENSLFYGTLSYNKLFGEDVNSVGNSQFDWITNEAAGNDNALNVKEAYWLYMNDSFLGNKDVSWTASIGRRPSTDGLGINLRVDQQRKSPLSHTVNVEFDGASVRFNLDKITGVEGMWLKFCAGRGLTNARLRFDNQGYDYAKSTTTSNVDLLGFIFVPYDNGQYSVHTNYAKAWNLIGYEDRVAPFGSPDSANFTDFGGLTLANIMFKADGIGDGISDYLDNSIFFASYAMSETDPNALGMLGSTDKERGHSYWVGINVPDGFTDDGRFGLEWNKGSKYWRSFTYGEDSMIGSKLAARGTAIEAYYNKNLTSALSASVRFTKIDYDYTGSNGFFGDFGAPMDTSSAAAGNAVKEAQNITGYIRYRF
ncbi:MAG: DUF3373 family protein [Candidatus Marinarcus sp.]|uniref:DUF3373 family protein n=1 Tax=Candidatus Marinarcus sp. TaxID=3100987 RepID=UPI003B00A255